jgi:DNA-binding LacI/PurR family transcriptional regulator
MSRPDIRQIIFLDIDGVLVTERTEHILIDRFAAFDADCVRELNRITAITRAQIVLSSSWRQGETIASMTEYMRSQGVNGNLIGFTKLHDDGDRRREILEWLGQQSRSVSFVILDDEYEFEELEVRRVLTSMETGLSAAHADRAIEILQQSTSQH